MVSPSALVSRARERRPFLDHLIRAYGRYGADMGDRLAASVTFYWFLSLFPVLLLVISLLGYAYGDESTEKVNGALAGLLPGNLIETIGETLEEAKGPAGAIGLVGLLFSGLGWIDGLRDALRTMWHQDTKAGNIVTRKLVDIVALVGLFLTIGLSIVLTGITTSATGWLLEQLGIAKSLPAQVFVQVLGKVLLLAADVGLFLYLFVRLAKTTMPFPRVLRGAVFGAVGFEVLKILGGVYVDHTTKKGEATYGTFAVVVGLLLFLNLVSRFLLFTAAWTVTAPYEDDVRPSGTADPEIARRAGKQPTATRDGKEAAGSRTWYPGGGRTTAKRR